MAAHRNQSDKSAVKSTSRATKSMSQAHKPASDTGRQESRAVRRYLEAVESRQPRRGRQRTVESIQRRLDAIEAELRDARSLVRLKLTQERRDLQSEQFRLEADNDFEELERAFVAAAKSYGDRNGISYASWRDVGVSADVLRRAGVPRY